MPIASVAEIIFLLLGMWFFRVEELEVREAVKIVLALCFVALAIGITISLTL